MASKHLTQYQNNHLKSDESIIANIKANAGKAMGKGHNKQINNGELILTTNELVFYKKGLTGETKNAIPLKNISSINTKSGMLTFDFVISSSGNDFHFNSTDKKGASSFESKLNSTLNGTSESSVKSAPKKKSGKFLKVGLAVFVVLMIIGSLIDEPETTTETANTSQEPKEIDPVLLANDCKLAGKMIDVTAPLLSKAISLQNSNADYQEIAQWRVNTFNPEIDKIKSDYDLTPKDMMNPDLEVSQTISNDVLDTIWFYVNALFTQARHGDNEEVVKEKLTTINEGIQFYNEQCTTK